MNRIITLGLTLAALGSAAGSAFAGKHCSCSAPEPVCCPEPCCASPITFHVERSEEKCTVEVPVKKEYDTKITESTKDVPCTRTVEVCVKDSCTGCMKTECHEEAYTKKVTCTTITVIPVHECTTKKETKTKVCTTVTMDQWCPPCCPAKCCGH